MSTFTNQNKSSASTYSDQAKSASTFETELRHGKTGTFDQIGDRPMDEDSTFDDQALQDQTFDQLSDQQWSNQTKN